MHQPPRLKGVLAPALTPFRADLAPDTGRFVNHCRWLLTQRVGLAVFGTTSEANSLSGDERVALLDALLAAGIDPTRMMPGTGCCSLTETVRLTAHAVRAGCAGVLMLPPFYYKAVTDDGLYRHFAEVIERVGDARLRIYLYHIPPVAVVGISPALVERLRKRYPDAIAGMKDSSGDWNNTRTMLDAFAASGFDVFVGSETFLLANMRAGGAGCISATANVNPAAIHDLYATWGEPSADAAQAALDVVRGAFAHGGRMIPSLKAAVAHFRHDPDWATLRPPLFGLDDSQRTDLVARLRAIGFALAGADS